MKFEIHNHLYSREMPRKYTRKRRTSRRARPLRIYTGGNTNDRCVFVYMIVDEGLGNQLFCLSTGLVALNKIERENPSNKMTLCIIPSGKNKHTSNTYADIYTFPPRIKVINEAEGRPRMNAGEKVLNLADGQPWAKWSNANIKYNSSSGKNAVIPDRLYQNYLAVQSVIPTVKEMFTKNEFEHASKKSAYESIKSKTPEGSAFIHVRRGDYKERNWELQDDFYIRGLEELNKDPNIKKIWVISNDLDWCKKIPWKTDKSLDYYDSKSELEVLYKMTICSAGAVISASTFSSWGAMLGPDMNPTSTIVYPLSWLTHGPVNSSNLKNYPSNPMQFPSRWKGIPNKV